MKYILYFTFTFLYINKGYTQLTSLYIHKSNYDKNKNRVFKQFNFKIKYENDDFSIIALNTDSTLFRIKPKVYYEIYDNKYLIASIEDSFYIKTEISTHQSFLPRNIAYIMPVNKFVTSKETYKVEFKNITIVENWKYPYPNSKFYYKIREINIPQRFVIVYNTVTKNIKKFTLIKLEN